MFNPDTGLVVPSTAEIRARIANDLQQCFYRPDEPLLDTEPSTPAGQMVDLIVAEVQSVYASFAYYIAQLSPATAEGRFQDAYASLYSIVRKVAQPSVVACVCSGVAGTKIPYGAQAKTTSGETVILTAPVTIGSSGNVIGYFRSATWGAVSIPAHSVNKIVTTVAGWEKIDNALAGVLGRERESHSEFEARRLKSIARNSHGAASSVEGAVANIDGVIDCAVLNNETNQPKAMYGLSVEAHSLAVCVFGGDDAQIAEAIYKKKDGGCGTTGGTTVKYKPENGLEQTYRIVRPAPENFDFKLTFSGSPFSEALQADIKQAIVDDFNGTGASGQGRVGIAQTIYATRFVSAVNSVLPNSSLKTLQIGWASESFGSDVTIDVQREPVTSVARVQIEFA